MTDLIICWYDNHECEEGDEIDCTNCQYLKDREMEVSRNE